MKSFKWLQICFYSRKLFSHKITFWVYFYYCRCLPEWVQTSGGTSGNSALRVVIRAQTGFCDYTELRLFPWLPSGQRQRGLWWVSVQLRHPDSGPQSVSECGISFTQTLVPIVWATFDPCGLYQNKIRCVFTWSSVRGASLQSSVCPVIQSSFSVSSRLSCWQFLPGGGVSSVSTGDLSGRRGAGLLQQVSHRVITCWSIIYQGMWVFLNQDSFIYYVTETKPGDFVF